MRTGRAFAVILALSMAGCAGEGDESAMPGAEESGAMESGAAESGPAETGARVEISSPEAGATVTGPDVTVELESVGFEVVEAGDTTANSGHHHLFLDRDVSPDDVAIPAEEGFIVHMGDGSESYTFQDVEPGEHRLITVVGDAYHVPVPGLVDTVTFTVQ